MFLGNRLRHCLGACCILTLLLSQNASGQDWRDTIGYAKLKELFKDKLEDGSGVRVSLVEPSGGPDPSNPEFSGKTLKFLADVKGGPSGHATTVGSILFGNTKGLVPGVTDITTFEATEWVTKRSQLGTRKDPSANPYAVQNHSYIGNDEKEPIATESLARFDYVVVRDRVTAIVGMNNGASTTLPQIYCQAYNGISVGRSDGAHSYGTTVLGQAGRVKPEIVAPAGTTSEATPMVSAVVALLHHKASNMEATDARLPEVMKAIVLAGASRSKMAAWDQATSPEGIIVRPIDDVFGAGEVNVYNSYRILYSGEFDGSSEDQVSKMSGLFGWDYGESIEPGKPLKWTVELKKEQGPRDLFLLLTWNAEYGNSKRAFSPKMRLPNMSLELRKSDGSSGGNRVAKSDSPVDNIEAISIKSLPPGKYTFGVETDLSTDFGIAWGFFSP